MKTILTNKFLIPLGILLTLVLLGGAAYFVVRQVIPTNQQSSNTADMTSQKSSAEKFYSDALDAEKKNDYTKAILSYQNALPYYKKSGNNSVQDMNMAYGIEGRIKALSAHKAAIDKQRQDAKNIPNVQFSE